MRDLINLICEAEAKAEADLSPNMLNAFYINVMQEYLNSLSSNPSDARHFPMLDDDSLFNAYAQVKNAKWKTFQVPQYADFSQYCSRRGHKIYG